MYLHNAQTLTFVSHNMQFSECIHTLCCMVVNMFIPCDTKSGASQPQYESVILYCVANLAMHRYTLATSELVFCPVVLAAHCCAVDFYHLFVLTL